VSSGIKLPKTRPLTSDFGHLLTRNNFHSFLPRPTAKKEKEGKVAPQENIRNPWADKRKGPVPSERPSSPESKVQFKKKDKKKSFRESDKSILSKINTNLSIRGSSPHSRLFLR